MEKHYKTICGNGEGVNIFLPGTGWAGDFGVPIAEALNNVSVTHMIDLPGIGRSFGLKGVIKLKDAANWLNEYIEENRLMKVNIIGHSLGGVIGLAYSFHYPEKVNRLILLDIGYSKIERFPVGMIGAAGYVLPIISVLHSIFGQKVLGKEAIEDHEKKEKNEMEIIKTIENLGLEDSGFIRKAIENRYPTTLAGISLLLAAYRGNLPKMVKRFIIPCLILYGDRGKMPNYIQSRTNRQIKKIRNAGVTVQSLNGGHYAHTTDSRSIEYITAFLLRLNSKTNCLRSFLYEKYP